MVPSLNFHPIRIKPGTIICTSKMFSKLDKLIASINKCKEVVFFVQPETKTSLCITIYSAEQSCNDCFVLGKTGDFKFLERQHYSFFRGERITNHFFKVTKKQGYKELRDYLMQTLQSININPYTLKGITVRFYETENMTIDIASGIPYQQ